MEKPLSWRLRLGVEQRLLPSDLLPERLGLVPLEALEAPEEFAADQARFVALIQATNTVIAGIAADAAAGSGIEDRSPGSPAASRASR